MHQVPSARGSLAQSHPTILGGVYPQSVPASWAVALDRLAADHPTALDLLTWWRGAARNRSR